MRDWMWTRAAQRLPSRRAVAFFLISASALAGCGGTTFEPPPTLTLRIDEFTITPDSVAITAGRERLVVHNSGVLVHELEIAQGTHLVAVTPPALPGKTVSTHPFTIAPGRYRIFDPIANYSDLGAYGTLTATKP
jgi:hypothetical protein